MPKLKIPKKEIICIRLKTKTLEKIDKICLKREEQRSELIRNIIEKQLDIIDY